MGGESGEDSDSRGERQRKKATYETRCDVVTDVLERAQQRPVRPTKFQRPERPIRGGPSAGRSVHLAALSATDGVMPTQVNGLREGGPRLWARPAPRPFLLEEHDQQNSQKVGGALPSPPSIDIDIGIAGERLRTAF